jgi:8-oxo-dGTP diphosphatase
MTFRLERELVDRLAARGLADGYAMELHPHRDDGELPWLRSDGPIVWLDEFVAGMAGAGGARAAMAELCMLADETGTMIALNPWARTGTTGLRQDGLEAFYQSLGFGWRRDHVMTRDPGAPTVVDVRKDVPYLPAPNRVELVFDGTCPRSDLTRSAFVIPVTEDGSIVMADNRRRGLEVPGGHIDPGETQEVAARREGGEEAGVTLGDLVPLGHLRMISRGEVPPGWRYPHPLSYQSFFAARVLDIAEYVENDECLRPRIVSDISTLKPHVQLMARRARTLVGIA